MNVPENKERTAEIERGRQQQLISDLRVEVDRLKARIAELEGELQEARYEAMGEDL